MTEEWTREPQDTRTYAEMLNDPWTKEDDKSRITADAVLGHAATVLARRGDHKIAMLLVNAADAEVGFDSEDGTYDNLWIDVEPEDLPEYTEEVLGVLRKLCQDIASRRGYDVGWVGVREVLPDVGPGWRDQLKAQVAGKRPTNQGRKMRLEPPKFTEDWLFFTNAGELAVYQALKQLQEKVLKADETIGIYPLAGGRVPGRTWEPDVLVTYKGRAGVIEIDGPHHNGRRAMDTSRDHLLRDAGVAFVDRITVEALDNPAELTAALQRFLRRLSETR